MIAQIMTDYNPLVTYNRKMKQWETRMGDEIQGFKPGPEGKLHARLAALAFQAPQVADRVLEIWAQSDIGDKLLARLIDAADIVLSGKVYQGRVIGSQTDSTLYPVDLEAHGYTCACESFQYKPVHVRGLGPVCKHALADHLAYLLDIDFAPAPIHGEGIYIDLNDIDLSDIDF